MIQFGAQIMVFLVRFIQSMKALGTTMGTKNKNRGISKVLILSELRGVLEKQKPCKPIIYKAL